MEELSQFNTMLQRMQEPAFRVENGIISHVNQAASAYLIEAGQSFAPMIQSGSQEYADFSAGDLYVTLSLAGIPVGAHISTLDNGNLVILEQSVKSPHLQAMVLAAKMLKEPLDGILNNAAQILPSVAAQGSEQELLAAQMNRRLYQMMRILNNMSDTAGYVQAHSGRMETVEICTFLEEILEKTATLTQESGISIAYDLPNEPIFTLADTERLERSVYNLLSNAIKSASPETAVRAKLVHKNKRLYFSVSNTHPGPGPQGNIFNRYLRSPAQLEDAENGIGLGLAIVCSTAMLHSGAVLVNKTEDGTRITMTLQVKASTPDQVRSPVLHFDYAGEHDHCLLELADVLPVQLYTPDQIN